MRRPILIALVIALLAVAGITALGFATGWDGPDRQHTETIRIIGSDGSTVAADNTIVIETNRGWQPFFPVGFLFFPLFVLGGLFLATRLMFGRRRWVGPEADGTPPPWFEQMHWRSHEDEWNQPRHSPPSVEG